eukprot:Nitzschia sp. Nitz4//scaffold110_size71422//41648//42817//NITZ4_005875-RA/size71422-processed-gene-0.9-mRNA-1//1//CDS//3329533092//1682//frame0
MVLLSLISIVSFHSSEILSLIPDELAEMSSHQFQPISYNTSQNKPFFSDVAECIPCTGPKKQELARYAPEFVIPGVQKGGTGFLARLIGYHPNVSQFRKEAHILDNNPTVRGDTIRQCDVWGAYQRRNGVCKNCEKVYFDKSPKYLWLSHLVPQRLACAVTKPVKLLVLLRNPSSRAYSHYQMNVRGHRYGTTGTKGEFYDAIVWEREKLELSGVHAGMLDKEEALGAWKRFHEGFLVSKNDNNQNKDELANNGTATMKTVVPEFLSRGLYAMQLSQWMNSLSKLWGMPKDELLQKYIMIIDSDEFKTTTHQEIMDRVLNFLGLPSFEYREWLIRKASKSSTYSSSPTDHERAFLEEFFRPYNADLHQLLAPYGIEIGFAKEAAMEANK